MDYIDRVETHFYIPTRTTPAMSEKNPAPPKKPTAARKKKGGTTAAGDGGGSSTPAVTMTKGKLTISGFPSGKPGKAKAPNIDGEAYVVRLRRFGV